jgi:hypothetical protein
MTLRELRVLVLNLPPDSATARRFRGHAWGDTEFLLADLLDTVRFHRAEWASSKGAKPPKPKPVTRPTPRVQPQVEDQRVLARAAHQHVLDHVLPRNGSSPGDPLPGDPPPSD